MGAALLPHMAPKSEQRRSVVSNSSRQSSLAGSAMLHLPRAARLRKKSPRMCRRRVSFRLGDACWRTGCDGLDRQPDHGGAIALLAMSVACCDDPELVLTFS
jgi:hypothetical protein